MEQLPKKETVLEMLGLQPLDPEGGLFTLTYTSSKTINIVEQGSNKERALMSSIYFMLTNEYPINYFHMNKADIMHYYHIGLPIRYHLVSLEGEYKTVVIGHDIVVGHHLQMLVRGGHWKAAELLIPQSSVGNDSTSGLYGLISEAVVHGFHFDDWSMAVEKDIKDLVLPEDYKVLKKFIKE